MTEPKATDTYQADVPASQIIHIYLTRRDAHILASTIRQRHILDLIPGDRYALQSVLFQIQAQTRTQS